MEAAEVLLWQLIVCLALQEVTNLNFSFPCTMMIRNHSSPCRIVPIPHIKILGQFEVKFVLVSTYYDILCVDLWHIAFTLKFQGSSVRTVRISLIDCHGLQDSPLQATSHDLSIPCGSKMICQLCQDAISRTSGSLFL